MSKFVERKWKIASGLGFALVLILLFGGLSLKPAFDRHVRRRRVIAEITRRGGSVVTEPGLLNSIAGTPQVRAVFVSRGLGSGADDDLAGLPELPELKQLAAQRCAISDAGLAFIEPLKQLEVINFTGTAIGDPGLAHLRECSNLEHLELSWTLITDSGLVFLKGLPKLTRLHLDGTQITDAGLEHLLAIGSLRNLDLSGTQVSPSGLCILKKLPALEVLTIKGMNLTPDEYNVIHAALPNVHINN